MAEMRSPVMATSARIQGLPLPSTILAPVMRVSKWVGMGSGRRLGGRNDYLSLDGMRVVATEFKATFFIVVLNPLLSKIIYHRSELLAFPLESRA